jgi:ABC-2 type transport system ATP-binding protein
MISIEGLSKQYGSNRVLENVTIRFDDGGVYGMVGENGAGKTTLFRCIAGLEKYAGTISSGFDRLKDHLGYLPTEPWYFPKMTGREYIRLLCQARGVKSGDTDSRNIFALPLDQYASTYSTGMKKKLALLAILMQENEIFILDEPFNGVDIQSNIVITEIIRRLKKLGRTVIISSHIFSTLGDTCDEIHLLKDRTVARSVSGADFGKLEAEMKESTIGAKIDNLGLG